MDMQKTMRAGDDLQNPHDTLLDVRDVTEIQISEQDLRVIAKGLTSSAKKLGAARLAIVAHK